MQMGEKWRRKAQSRKFMDRTKAGRKPDRKKRKW